MNIQFWVIQVFNGVSYGALLFLVGSGLSLIFGVMRIVNLSHGAYFLWGGYIALSVIHFLTPYTSYAWAISLPVAALGVAAIGIAMERLFLRSEGLAFLRLSVTHPDEPFFLVQSDCIRKPEAAFLQMIEDAGKLVEQNKKLITGGIKAREADMGVDYLKLGERISTHPQEVYEVETFLNRVSSYHETKRLIEGYNVVTHPNHYCWYQI